MKISYSFYSLKDLSDLSNGERLLEILLSYGLDIEKVDDREPIRKDFIATNISEMWKGVGIEGRSSSCYFLFKGKKKVKFTGMVIWGVNLHPNCKTFNGIHLWLDIPKKYSINELVLLGDDIFVWSEAVYGYITEDSKDNNMGGDVYRGIPGLVWVNYFGIPYKKESEFHIPDDHKTVGNGVRLMLSETPNDERLSDSDFLESIKNKFGVEWFWSNPRKYKIKVPSFDRTAITKR